ncbi:hypothetical protein LTR32_006750 [Rachicladosporium monterosium]|uniref:Uncharacterized protein n=1 Tax=Rachicladosporium monterosium TaxID=1507873 RepID=A0ABR0KY00_9PEZI|nr:hypothetical protein LTR32_006750 [Rachicladosporium monterosium]
MATGTASTLFSVDGKTAIVTGAGSGINYSFAKLLLSRNCNVVIADLGLRPEAQKLVDEYSSPTGKARAVFVKTNVVQWPELENMFVVAEKEFGGADIVCPGADSPQPPSGIGHYALLDINLTHPIRCTQLAISRWLNPAPNSKVGKASLANPKRVVHISSIAGQTPSFSTPMYVASKHAISGFIRSLAQLDTVGIRVNGVAPGIIKTPLWTDHPEKLQMLDSAQDAWVEPSEVAEAMLRCCEEDSVVGGWVLEVGKGQTRNVEWRDDPGPRGAGMSAGNAEKAVGEVFGWLGEEGWGVA